jgi:uncharacterized protein YndB with AHSA1/START domain
MYSASIDIAATPSRVFAILTDQAVLKQLQPEIIELRPPEGGLRVGAVGEALVEEFGRRFTVQMVVAALEPDARLAYDMTTPLWSGRIEYVLTSQAPGTHLSFRFVPDRPNVSGPIRVAIRVMALLTRPLMQRRIQSRLAAIRRIVEANGQGDSTGANGRSSR